MLELILLVNLSPIIQSSGSVMESLAQFQPCVMPYTCRRSPETQETIALFQVPKTSEFEPCVMPNACHKEIKPKPYLEKDFEPCVLPNSCG